MSKDNQITGYPSNDLYAQFMMKKDLMGLSQSAAVSLAIDCWVKQDVYNKAEDLVRPTEDKLDQILNNQRYILDAVYGTVNVAICLFVIFDINTTI